MGEAEIGVAVLTLGTIGALSSVFWLLTPDF
jgi:hypothetical protein